jgi:hypothetical protein
MTDPVTRWRRALRTTVGLDASEIEARVAALHTFCAGHDTEPAEVLAHWDRYGELTARRDRAGGHEPDTVVESFLIHNGVNVFGDLVCIPKNADDLRQQWNRPGQ